MEKISSAERQGAKIEPTSSDLEFKFIIDFAWRRKWVVIATTMAVIALVFLYVVTTTPVYVASSKLLPPTKNNLLKLGVEREQAFKLFLEKFGSVSLRKNFFENSGVAEQIVPTFDNLQKEQKTLLFEAFSDSIVVEATNNNASISITGTDRESISNWLDSLVAKANEDAVSQLVAFQKKKSILKLKTLILTSV